MPSTTKNAVLKKMKEKPVEEYLKERCEARGGFCLKLNPAWAIGITDRLCVWQAKLHGRYDWTRIAFVEVKRPKGGKLRSAQKWWKNKLTGLRVEWHLCSTKDEVDALIDGVEGNDWTRDGRCKIS